MDKEIEERLTYGKGIFEPLDVIILTDARPISGNRNISDRFCHFFYINLKDNKQVMKELYSVCGTDAHST